MRYLSVCSGIEAATVAWHPLGWTPVAFAEVEKFPSAALKYHYPNVPNWGDITKFQEWPDAAIDVLVGGTPCQSFSVAGLRKGMADPRGNLALVYLGIVDRYRPEWLVWENVPGVLSSNDGRDFGAFLGGLGELGYGFAYRVLDAQYFGLAQRRKRVFVVGHLGDWRRAAAVLFEPESLRGHPPPSRKTGQGVAPTLSARTEGGGGLGTDFDVGGGLIANPLLALANSSHDDSKETYVPVAFGGGNQAGAIDVATAQTAHSGRIDFESETFVAQVAPCLRAGGNDTGGDRPYGTDVDTCDSLVALGVVLRGREGGATAELTGETMTALRTGGGGGDKPHVLAPTIAFSAKDHGADAMDDLSPTLRAGGHNESHANAGVMSAVLQGWRVRRLTPRECERLQGFPDDYTAIRYGNGVRPEKITDDWIKYVLRGNPKKLTREDVARLAADGPRYKALGNSMATPVMRWIGEGIAAIATLTKRDAA